MKKLIVILIIVGSLSLYIPKTQMYRDCKAFLEKFETAISFIYDLKKSVDFSQEYTPISYTKPNGTNFLQEFTKLFNELDKMNNESIERLNKLGEHK